jgi:hypothetical protein
MLKAHAQRETQQQPRCKSAFIAIEAKRALQRQRFEKKSKAKSKK